MLDLNTSWLKLSYFTLTHKEDFRKWYIIVLLALAVFMSVFVVTNTILYVLGGPANNRLVLTMTQDQVDYTAIRQRNAPVELVIPQTYAVPVGETKADLIAPVSNPNVDWFAIVTYAPASDTDAAQQTIINPQSDGFLTVFGASGTSDSLAIQSVEWQHVDNHEPPPDIHFVVSNVQYNTLSAAGTTVHQITADITNDSYTSYFSVPFIVVLYNGDQIVGAQHTMVAPFDFGTTRSITVKLSAVAGTVTGTRIIPTLNLLDQTNISAVP